MTSPTWKRRALHVALITLSAVMGPFTLLDIATRYPQDAVVSYWTFRLGPHLYDLPAFAYASHEYPPVFAQLLAPLTSMPWGGFLLAWLAIQLALLLAITGPRWFGVALLLPPVRDALWGGNLTF